MPEGMEGKEIARLVAQLEQALQAEGLTLSERDHAVLAILYIRRQLHLPSVKKARELALAAWGQGAVPSEATISLHREPPQRTLATACAAPHHPP